MSERRGSTWTEARVVLTPEEAGMAASWFYTHQHEGIFPPADDALAARLRAASG